MAIALLARAAQAQTADYFATPWIVAPVNPPVAGSESGTPTQNQNTSAAPAPPTGAAPRSKLYAQALASAMPNAPPVIYAFNAGIDELATDNVQESKSDRTPDLSSFFSTGLTVTADTQKITGVLSATGTYRKNINATDLDQFSEYGYGNGRITVIPSHLYISGNGMIDDLSQTGGGIQNTLLQSGQNTHSYTVSGSPYFVSRFGDFALNILRYQVGQAWFSNPSGSVGFNSEPLSDSTYQAAREDLKMAGTLLPRLLSDMSLSATQNNSGNSQAGVLRMANGELLNEYEATRWAGIIGGAGYEYLRDNEVFGANGEGLTWDIGARLRPNADSSLLLVYGRHSLKSDFAGEFAWRLTPFTSLYVSYSDFFSTAQQSVISGNADSVLGPDGAVSGVGFDQSPIIGVLNDRVLNEAPGSDIIPLGVPLSSIESATPLQNGLFRTKVLSGSASTIFEQDPIALTAYDVQQISLTPFLVPSTAAEGGNISWSPAFSEDLSGLFLVGFAHVTGMDRSDVYNAAVGATYKLSDTLSLLARYDFILRDSPASTGGYLQNAVTIALHKSFE